VGDNFGDAEVPAVEPRVPPLTASLTHRAVLTGLRTLPIAKQIALSTYRKIARRNGRVRLARTYFGALMECDLSDFIPECIYHFHVWEPHISAAIQKLLSPGETFCDVGANIGYHSLLASLIVGPQGRVIAIEPSPSIVTKLRKNLSLNPLLNIRVVPVAVNSERGTVSIYTGSKSNTAHTTTVAYDGATKECDVECLPLSEILTDEDRSHLGVIKIDVEGGEPPILNQLLNDLDKYPRHFHILIEMSDAPENKELFVRLLRVGFEAHAIPNSYDMVGGYLRLGPIISPVPISALPASQQDVLFSR
jgi:FkbM family methyltransferase